MKRIGALLILGFAVIWGAALFDVRSAAFTTTPRKSVPHEQPATQMATVSARPALSTVPAYESADPAPADSTVVHKQPVKSGVSGAIARAAHSGFVLVGSAARTLFPKAQPAAPPKASARKPAPEGTGELGEGVLSPEFTEYEQRYAREVRDGDWAPSQEERVHALLKTQSWADDVGLVHCQQTLCRIVVETEVDARDTYQQLIGVPGLSEATGLGPETPYSLRSGQLSVYFRGRATTSTL